MNKRFLSATLIGFLFFALTSSAKEPPNISFVKTEAIAYYQNGSYANDINATLTSAKNYLASRIQLNSKLQNPNKLAIVLDIDETALSNYPHLLAMDFSFMPKQMDTVINQSDAKPLTPILELYRYATEHNIAVFFVTGRKETLLPATIKNLHNAGYQHWAGLYTKPSTYILASTIPYKTQARKQITEQGYKIVANIGDQASDLAGGYSERTFKLPNPFYYIP